MKTGHVHAGYKLVSLLRLPIYKMRPPNQLLCCVLILYHRRLLRPIRDIYAQNYFIDDTHQRAAAEQNN